MHSSRKKRSILSNLSYKESCRGIKLIVEEPDCIKQAPKKKSWFRRLYPSHCTLSNLFKKPTAIQPIELPVRYPLAIENAIYHISNMRLDNQNRPLRHHVVISNMLIQHTNLIQQQNQPPYTS